MSSGFITETDAAKARLIRQEEWERVRKPEDPKERPEEDYDGRSLYARLKDQKDKKDMEYEEAHKLKNLIRGLDDDEVQFLEMVDQQKIDAERKQVQEEQRELQEYRERVANLQEVSAEKKLKAELQNVKLHTCTSTNSTRPTQKTLLSAGIKRKNGETVDLSIANSEKLDEINESASENQNEEQTTLPSVLKLPRSITTTKYDKGALKCIGILPGIGSYTESSDSEVTSGSDDELEKRSKYDLCGRKKVKRTHE